MLAPDVLADFKTTNTILAVFSLSVCLIGYAFDPLN
jgi:hypothetical protein